MLYDDGQVRLCRNRRTRELRSKKGRGIRPRFSVAGDLVGKATDDSGLLDALVDVVALIAGIADIRQASQFRHNRGRGRLHLVIADIARAKVNEVSDFS